MSVVRFENVSKIFANGYIGLKDISFAIEPDTLTYIVGESGAGKTTLMRLLIRELSPTEGEIYVEDDPISGLSEGRVPHLRRKVAVVFQDYKLIADRTIAENVALPLEIAGAPAREIHQQVQEVLELVGLGDRGDMFPAQLSGGELQRVSIARALVMSPKVLYADEPTGNLDPKTSRVIGELLKKISELGTTVVVSTHDQILLELFPGREIHLSKGSIVKDTGAKHTEKKVDHDDEDEEDDDHDDDEHEPESDEKEEKKEKKKKKSKKEES